jgi:arylsulfatase
MKVGAKTFKVHLDGYNITDALAGKSPSPRHEFSSSPSRWIG